MKIFKQLNKFEISLWIASAILVTTSFCLTPSQNVLTLVASLIGVTALIFCAKGLVFGQILIVVFSIFYGIISFWFAYYGEMITYLCISSPIAICAVVSWIKHPYKQSKQVEVSQLTKKQVLLMLVLSIIVTIAFYFILKALNNANLIISTISVTTSFLAAFLTFLRSPLYGLGYAANDVVLIVLWVLASIENIAYLPMIVCFVVFFVNDIYGFVNWRKIQKSQKEN